MPSAGGGASLPDLVADEILSANRYVGPSEGQTDLTAAAAVRAPRRGPLRAAIATARPRQWIKNALVIAAAGAAGALGRDDVPVHVGLACLAFCLLASGICYWIWLSRLPRERYADSVKELAQPAEVAA